MNRIYIWLTGRIGNNLFQIAATASLAEKYNCQLITIPFHYKISEPDNCLLSKYLKQFQYSILRNIHIEEELPPHYVIYQEPFFHYAPLPFRKDILFNGFFQSHKYFNEQLVRSLFAIDTDTHALLVSKYPHLIREKMISINIRRGDFIKHPDYHPICPLEYFKQAIDLLGHDRNFFITSDDLEWCKEHFKGNNFYFAEHTHPLYDLYLQTLCTDNIISNSTFSWWGAWLNPRPEKRVIAPKKWFGPEASDFNTKDLLPDLWTKI